MLLCCQITRQKQCAILKKSYTKKKTGNKIKDNKKKDNKKKNKKKENKVSKRNKKLIVKQK